MHYSLNNILFIIVLYNCKLSESKTFLSLKKTLKNDQRLNIFIYDNSLTSQEVPTNIENIHIVYVSDVTNSGVSKAYNEGHNYAIMNGYKWIVLLDQDTFTTDELLKGYVNTINKYKSIRIAVPRLMTDKNVVYSPALQLFYKTFMYRYKVGINNLKWASLLNSGMLLSVDLFKEVGGYNEKIYLDYSDVAFINKLKKKEKSFYVMNVHIIHELSSTDTDYNKVLSRFKHYCNCSKEFVKESSGIVVFWCFIRALKLSIKFKTTSFIREYKKCFC